MSPFSFSFVGAVDLIWAQIMHLVQSEFLNAFCKYFSLASDKGILFFLIGLTLVCFKKTRYAGANMLICVGVALFLSFVLKTLFDRPRPFSDKSSQLFEWWLSAGGAPASDTGSFPSAHTAAAFAFAASLLLSTDKKLHYLTFPFAFMTGAARTYLMVHYLSDVVFGALVGILGAVAGHFIIEFLIKIAKKKPLSVMKSG